MPSSSVQHDCESPRGREDAKQGNSHSHRQSSISPSSPTPTSLSPLLPPHQTQNYQSFNHQAPSAEQTPCSTSDQAQDHPNPDRKPAMAHALLSALQNKIWPLHRQHDHHRPLPQNHASKFRPSIDSTTSTLADDGEKDPRSRSRRSWFSPRVLADATIGLSDGLTVPFALTAGLSALGDTRVVIYGGCAELIAGAISMGVGGYLGANGECQAYDAALSSVRRDAADDKLVDDQIRTSLGAYGLSETTLAVVAAELRESPDALEEFLIKFHHEQSDEAASGVRAYVSGLTIALGYFFGGLLPLLPYLFCADMGTAFWASCAVMLNVLFGFGSVKSWLIDGQSKRVCVWHGVQMVVLGGLAAAAAMGCVMLIGSGDD